MHFLSTAARRLAAAIDQRISRRFRFLPLDQLYSLPEQEHLKKLISYFQIDCVFDVGGNVGQYAQMLRKTVQYTGRIVTFEPIPECAERIRELARADDRWTVEEIALSDKEGEATFNVMEDSEFSSLFVPENRDVDLSGIGNNVTREIRVRVDTLMNQYDAKRRQFGFKSPFLKMDTQGNDLIVAAGARERLQEFVALQSELSIVPIYSRIPSFREAIAFYEDHGFKLSALVPNNPGHFPRLVEIDGILYNERMVAEREQRSAL